MGAREKKGPSDHQHFDHAVELGNAGGVLDVADALRKINIARQIVLEHHTAKGPIIMHASQ